MSAADDQTTPDDGDATAQAAPVFRIVKGNPTDEDVASIVAVLAAASGSGEAPPSGPRDLWGTPTDRLRPAEPLAPLNFVNLRFGY
ncbi:acyl-CoA carboxylase subunit epsilon [Williamsia phyllosphaerae]|uniref:Acyl-CoA carboxylase subunit epsilon n=1 Tax=Williamsia phyllosphaerae TaxID=885042 RepID=A0ABQ1UZ89_9NOCA|nr:acyl-CoA carboxylase subunit epsilon [Williamsia phyllosphaerae]GGF31337.1 hypothetical protein GCM10007298_28960 [Williamsia phyllosphaerae]